MKALLRPWVAAITLLLTAGISVPAVSAVVTEAPSAAASSGAADIIDKVKPASSLVEKGEFGIVIYTFLFVIVMLMLFYIIEKYLNYKTSLKISESMKNVADSLQAIQIQWSRSESLSATMIAKVEDLQREIRFFIPNTKGNSPPAPSHPATGGNESN